MKYENDQMNNSTINYYTVLDIKYTIADDESNATKTSHMHSDLGFDT